MARSIETISSEIHGSSMPVPDELDRANPCQRQAVDLIYLQRLAGMAGLVGLATWQGAV